jgi:hypothetical protein
MDIRYVKIEQKYKWNNAMYNAMYLFLVFSRADPCRATTT